MTDPAQAVLQLARVHGRDTQGSAGESLGRLHGITQLLYPGVHAFLGEAADGTAAIVELCSGRSRPRIGAVLVAGRAPHRSPRRRRRIGALLARPELPDTHGEVAEILRLVGQVRGADLLAELTALGASALAGRELLSLSHAEARAVELCIALGSADPLVVALYEPFVDVDPIDGVAVRQRIAALGRAGACVVLASSRPAEVEGLADHVHLLARGRLVGSDEQLGWPGAAGGQMTLWLAGRDGAAARRLAAALGDRGSPNLAGVAWEQPTPDSPPTVVARVTDVAAGAITIAETVAELDVQVTALHTEPLSLHALAEAARAHEAARQAAAVAVTGPASPAAPGGGQAAAVAVTGSGTPAAPGAAEAYAFDGPPPRRREEGH